MQTLQLISTIAALSFTLMATGAANTMEDETRPIVIIGASYAGSWPIDSLAGRRVVNKGIGGNQSFEMEKRFGRDVLAIGPDKVLIWGFINDIFRSDIQDLDTAKARIRTSYMTMISSAEKQGIDVILATEVSLGQPAGLKNWVASIFGKARGKASYQDLINLQVAEVNGWLRDYATARNLTLLDFNTLLSESDGKRKARFSMDDGSHLTGEAYEAMSDYAREVLNAEYSVVKEVR